MVCAGSSKLLPCFSCVACVRFSALQPFVQFQGGTSLLILHIDPLVAALADLEADAQGMKVVPCAQFAIPAKGANSCLVLAPLP